MKRFLLIISGLIAFAATVSAQTAAEANRQYILEKMVFYYVDNPATAKPADLSTLEINKVAIGNGEDIASPLWTNANNEGLKSLLIQLLRPASQGGNVNLQRNIRNVLLITDKKVYVYLYNDFANAAKHASWPVYCTTTGYETAHSNASWPCASCFTDRTLEATGHIGLGAFFFNASRTGDWATANDKGAVTIHELVHTQLPLKLEPTLTVSMYGTGGHSFSEMIPSRNSAFNEGIANAFGFRYYFPNNLQMSSWFNNNVQLTVDNLSGCSATSTQPHCLQARLAAAGVATQPTTSTVLKRYNIRDVPANLITYCENTTTNILFMYMSQFRSDLMLVRDVKRAATDMGVASNYTFAPLFKEMVKSGLNYHNPGLRSGLRTHGQHMPLAILDYYTGYKLTNKAALEQVLGVTWDASYPAVDEYFANKRSVLLGFRPNATTWQVRNLDQFAEHINVKTSESTRPSAPAAPGGR